MKKSRSIKSPQPTRTDAARKMGADRVLDTDRYIPIVVGSLTTKLRASAQEYFSRQFGITRLEWRIISFLAIHGPSSAYDIWTQGSLDKAAVSRAIRTLEERSFVLTRLVKSSSRGKMVATLTSRGRAINDRSFTEIVRRHDRLVAGLSNAEIDKFIAVARHLESRISLMDTPPEKGSMKYDPTKARSSKDDT